MTEAIDITEIEANLYLKKHGVPYRNRGFFMNQEGGLSGESIVIFIVLVGSLGAIFSGGNKTVEMWGSLLFAFGIFYWYGRKINLQIKNQKLGKEVESLTKQEIIALTPEYPYRISSFGYTGEDLIPREDKFTSWLVKTEEKAIELAKEDAEEWQTWEIKYRPDTYIIEDYTDIENPKEIIRVVNI